MIERSEYTDRLLSWLGKPVIKILYGMRRVGKSSILSLFKDTLGQRGYTAQRILHINMELIENASYASAEALHRKVKTYFTKADMKQVLLVDEVQEIPGWERVINSLHAEMWCDIIITGSNAQLFSGELASLLSGRYVQIRVFPLSLTEFITFRQIHSDVALRQSLEDAFYLWLRWGGLPGLHHVDFTAQDSDESALGTEYLRAILDTIMLKDVVMRNKIRDPAFLAVLVQFICDNIGKVFSAKSISNWLKAQKQTVSIETIQNYLLFLEDAQLVYIVKRADLQGKKLLAYQQKLFISDLGLRHALIGYRADDIAGLLENVVYQELARRSYTICVGQKDGLEIDFIATREHEKLYLQVCYLLASPETIEREFSVLESVPDNYPKIVLSMDKAPFAGRNGIMHRYLPEWLVDNK